MDTTVGIEPTLAVWVVLIAAGIQTGYTFFTTAMLPLHYVVMVDPSRIELEFSECKSEVISLYTMSPKTG